MMREITDGTRIPLTMPNHPTIKGSTLRTICTQAGIDRAEFLHTYEQARRGRTAFTAEQPGFKPAGVRRAPTAFELFVPSFSQLGAHLSLLTTHNSPSSFLTSCRNLL